MNRQQDTGERTRQKQVLDARAKAIAYIGVGRKTSGRVRSKLIRSQVTEEIAEQVIDDLENDGYIDDTGLGISYVRTRIRSHVESRRSLRHRLLGLGHASAAVDRILEAFPDLETPETTLPALRKKFRALLDVSGTLSSEASDGSWLRMARYLQSRGFTQERIRSILSELEQPGE